MPDTSGASRHIGQGREVDGGDLSGNFTRVIIINI